MDQCERGGFVSERRVPRVMYNSFVHSIKGVCVATSYCLRVSKATASVTFASGLRSGTCLLRDSRSRNSYSFLLSDSILREMVTLFT